MISVCLQLQLTPNGLILMTYLGAIVLFVVKNGCLYVMFLLFLIKIHKFADIRQYDGMWKYMRNYSI